MVAVLFRSVSSLSSQSGDILPQTQQTAFSSGLPLPPVRVCALLLAGYAVHPNYRQRLIPEHQSPNGGTTLTFYACTQTFIPASTSIERMYEPLCQSFSGLPSYSVSLLSDSTYYRIRSSSLCGTASRILFGRQVVPFEPFAAGALASFPDFSISPDLMQSAHRMQWAHHYRIS